MLLRNPFEPLAEAIKRSARSQDIFKRRADHRDLDRPVDVGFRVSHRFVAVPEGAAFLTLVGEESETSFAAKCRS